MKSKRVASITRGKELVEQRAQNQLGASMLSEEQADGLKLLGAVQAGLNISRSVSARSVRVLQSFIEAKGYEALGYDNLTDFLNESPHSPLTKNQYYDRIEVLDKEGDATFDLLNNLRIPVSARKLLSASQIVIEGDLITIGEESFAASDTKRVKETLRGLAQELATSRETIQKGEKEVAKLKKKVDQAKESASHQPAPYEQALLNLLGSFTALRAELEKLTPEERQQKCDYTLDQIANQRLLLEEAFGFNGPMLTPEEREAGIDDLGDID
jgi:hypothetical protein